VTKAMGETIQEVTLVTRYLVYRFVLSAALVPVAVSHDLGENKAVIMPGRATSLQRVLRARRRTHAKPTDKISSKAREPFAQI
jgi:hypothetical protein